LCDGFRIQEERRHNKKFIGSKSKTNGELDGVDKIMSKPTRWQVQTQQDGKFLD
jgi:hypothetical protein